MLDQGPFEARSLDDTLDRAWEHVVLPRRELTMIPTHLLDRHLPEGG